MTMSTARLDALMNERRLDLGMRWKDVYTQADVSNQTLYEVRKGSQVSDLTITMVERALRWEPGSITRIQAGGDPTPVEGADPLTAPEWWEEVPPGENAPLAEGEMLAWRRDARGTVYRLEDASGTSVQGPIREGVPLDRIVEDLRELLEAHRMQTDLLERRRARG